MSHGDLSGDVAALRRRGCSNQSPDDTALAAAFAVLQKLELPTPSITAIVAAAPKGQRVSAYRLQRADGSFDATIYVVSASQVFQRARVGNLLGIVLLASTLRHEQLHADGADERQALLGEVDLIQAWIRVTPDLSSGDRKALETEAAALQKEAQKQP